MKSDNHSKPLVAICSDPSAAQRTIEALLAAGVQSSEIAVVSSVPLEQFEHEQNPRATWMPWLVFMGAIIGGLCGYFLVSLTQKSYPIVTGGMAVVPLWTDGIVTYELTMLGAILATLLTLIWSAPLLHWKDRGGELPADHDKILVEVTVHSPEVSQKVSTILTNASSLPRPRHTDPSNR